MNDQFLIQLIGLIAASIAFVVFQSNKRHKMLLLQVGANLLWVVHFTLLGASTASALNAITAGRNLSYYSAGKNRNRLIPLFFAGIFALATYFTWEGPISLLPLAGCLIGTLAFWQLKTHHIRLIVLVSPSLWLIYNVHVGSYAGVASDTSVISSIAVAIYRFDVKPALRRSAHFGSRKRRKSKPRRFALAAGATRR
jgi:hypothetical protein